MAARQVDVYTHKEIYSYTHYGLLDVSPKRYKAMIYKE